MFDDSINKISILISELNGLSLEAYSMMYFLDGDSIITLQSTDTTIFQEVVEGPNNKHLGYRNVASKRIDNQDYGIILQSRNLSREESDKIMKHIYSSLKANPDKTPRMVNGIMMKTYNNDLFSILLPIDWSFREYFDNSIDLFAHDEDYKLILQLSYHDIDDANEEIVNQLADNDEYQIDKDHTWEMIPINGRKYRKMFSITGDENQLWAFTSYNLMKDDKMYNLMFISDGNNYENDTELIESIISSFKIH